MQTDARDIATEAQSSSSVTTFGDMIPSAMMGPKGPLCCTVFVFVGVVLRTGSVIIQRMTQEDEDGKVAGAIVGCGLPSA